MKKCENCEKEHDGEYGSGRFCSSKCARGFSTKAKRKEINEKVSLSLSKINKCVSCNEVKDNSKRSKYCKDCRSYSRYEKMFRKLNLEGYNYKTLNDKALNVLSKMYFTDKLSKNEITQKTKILSNTIFKFFKLNNIKLRSLSEANSNYILQGGEIKSSNSYKNGYHRTWENKDIYYRSSYELEYAKILDERKIKYDVELLRIEYYDSKKEKIRIAVPDFYLSETNTIVEIKSTFSLDKKNMEDKSKEYKKIGYNFILCVNQEYKFP
jgi:hypothetical protein